MNATFDDERMDITTNGYHGSGLVSSALSNGDTIRINPFSLPLFDKASIVSHQQPITPGHDVS
jgi:hypothetical protein